MEIDREAALPLTADDALPQTREIASHNELLHFEKDLRRRTMMRGDAVRLVRLPIANLTFKEVAPAFCSTVFVERIAPAPAAALA